jgi:hypothetical protein
MNIAKNITRRSIMKSIRLFTILLFTAMIIPLLQGCAGSGWIIVDPAKWLKQKFNLDEPGSIAIKVNGLTSYSSSEIRVTGWRFEFEVASPVISGYAPYQVKWYYATASGKGGPTDRFCVNHLEGTDDWLMVEVYYSYTESINDRGVNVPKTTYMTTPLATQKFHIYWPNWGDVSDSLITSFACSPDKLYFKQYPCSSQKLMAPELQPKKSWIESL